MAILNQVNKYEYEHYAWMYGVIPVYIRDTYTNCPDIAVRNWIPEFILDVVETVVMTAASFYQLAIDAEYEPMFMFKITGEIK